MTSTAVTAAGRGVIPLNIIKSKPPAGTKSQPPMVVPTHCTGTKEAMSRNKISATYGCSDTLYRNNRRNEQEQNLSHLWLFRHTCTGTIDAMSRNKISATYSCSERQRPGTRRAMSRNKTSATCGCSARLPRNNKGSEQCCYAQMRDEQTRAPRQTSLCSKLFWP